MNKSLVPAEDRGFGCSVFGDANSVWSITIRSKDHDHNCAVFKIANFLAALFDKAQPLCSGFKDVRKCGWSSCQIRFGNNKLIAFHTQPTEEAIGILDEANSCNRGRNSSTVSNGRDDKPRVIVPVIPSNRHVRLNANFDTRATFKPPTYFESKSACRYNGSVNCDPIVVVHRGPPLNFRCNYCTPKQPDATECKAGVGSDFRNCQGTGGGRSAQDTPKITFSEREAS